MPTCIATGCDKQVRSGSRCEMHRAEFLYEGVDDPAGLLKDQENDWVVSQQGLDGDAEGQSTLDGGISKEASR